MHSVKSYNLILVNCIHKKNIVLLSVFRCSTKFAGCPAIFDTVLSATPIIIFFFLLVVVCGCLHNFKNDRLKHFSQWFFEDANCKFFDRRMLC